MDAPASSWSIRRIAGWMTSFKVDSGSSPLPTAVWFVTTHTLTPASLRDRIARAASGRSSKSSTSTTPGTPTSLLITPSRSRQNSRTGSDVGIGVEGPRSLKKGVLNSEIFSPSRGPPGAVALARAEARSKPRRR